MSEREKSQFDHIQRATEVVTEAYRAGFEQGRIVGYEEQARDHHQWLLDRDDQLAETARLARRFALLDAASAWDAEGGDELHKIAEQHYRAGGSSMPTIWLRLRAESDPDPSELRQSPAGGGERG